MASCLISQVFAYISYVDIVAFICRMNCDVDEINIASTATNIAGCFAPTETHKIATQTGWNKGIELGRIIELFLTSLNHMILQWWQESVLRDNGKQPLPQEIVDYRERECGGNTIS